MMARPRKNAAASRASLLPESAPLPEIPVREQPYPLPEGWKWVRLGDVTQIASGGTPSSKTKEFYDNGNIPWLSPADLSNYTAVYISHGKKMLTPLGLKNSSARLLPSNTVCLSSRAPIGYVVIAQNPLCTNQGFKNFLPSHLYTPRFLYWYLKGSKPLLESYASGTTFLELSATKVARIPFPLPPREEQERIVGHIESLFARLDEARQKAEAVRDSVALRRAAILHKAFTGELTAKWREEQGVECWPLTTLHKVSSLITKGASPKWQGISYVEDETQTLFVTSENVREGYLKFENKKFVEDSINIIQKRSCLKYGDILINIVGASIGRAAIYQEKYKANINQAVCLVRLYENISSSYVCYYLNSPAALTYYFENKVETARANLSLADINNITLPLPTLPEQREIVRILDDLLGREQRIREAADAVVAHIERMKKAILARAFRGELGRADCPSRP